ncbi:MAG: methyl-accepting chemotaxis protein, partial [Planctomycetota bacterium]
MLKRLKIWQKLALISLAFALAIPAILYLALNDRFQERERVLVRAEGLQLISELYEVFEGIPRHRGLMNAYLGGNFSELERAQGLIPEINAGMAAIESVDQTLADRFDTTQDFSAIRQGWNELSSEAGAVLPSPSAQGASWRRHTGLIADILLLIQKVADNSGLRADPDIGNSYLVRSLTESFPTSAENLGQLRGLGSGFAARQEAPVGDAQGELIFLSRSIDRELTALENAVRIIGGVRPEVQGELDQSMSGLAVGTRTFLNAANDEVIFAEEVTVPSAEYFDLGTAAITPYFGVQETMLRQLNGQIAERLATLQNEIALVVAVVIAAALLTLGLVILIARSITGQVNRLNELFAEINQGRFSTRARVTSSDELGNMTGSLNTMLDNTLVLIQDRAERDQIQRSIRRMLEQVSDVADGDLRSDLEVTEDMTGSIADSFNYMLEELRTIIGGVQATTTRVTDSAARLTGTSQELATGSMRQTQEIEKTADSVRLLATSAQEVSVNAETSSQVAQEALDSARAGGQAVERTIEGMGKIRQRVQDTSKRIKRLGESSQQIGEIVELISDLADRTSLLALNASIQAASAGEAGRSFAVVAKEVEQLADRSTESTKRIAQLINNIQRETAEASTAMEDTTREVVEGSQVATDAGRALEEIEKVSSQLSDIAGVIVERARRQAEVSDGVAEAIGQIDAISRQTSGGVQQTVSVLGELASTAQQLRDSVATFRLPE